MDGFVKIDKIIRESIEKYVNGIISENTIDRKINNTIKSCFNVTDFDEIRNIRAKVLNLVPNARTNNCKFLPYVIGFYSKGVFENPQNKNKLNRALGLYHKGELQILDRTYFWRRWEDLSELIDEEIPSEETVNKFSNTEGNKKVQRIGNYTIYRTDNFEEAKYIGRKYNNDYGTFCISNEDDIFYDMTNGYTIYYCIRDDANNVRPMSIREFARKLKKFGYKEVYDFLEEEELLEDDDEMYGIYGLILDYPSYVELPNDAYTLEKGIPPSDSFGTSVMVVGVNNMTGQIEMVYSRYNFPNMFDGMFLSDEELSEVIGKDSREVFTVAQ